MSEWDGRERREDRAEEYGELKATVASNTKSIDKIFAFLQKHADDEKVNTKAIQTEMQKIHDELIAYKTFMRIVKGIGAMVLLALTFKFGDIAEVWRNM